MTIMSLPAEMPNTTMPSILDFNSLIIKLNHFYKKPVNFVGRKDIVNLRDRPVPEQWDINKQRNKIQSL